MIVSTSDGCMEKRLQEILYERFPETFKGLHLPVCDWPHPIAERGIEIDDGWFALLYTLSDAFERVISTLPDEQKKKAGFWQIKQKFGQLTLYYSCPGGTQELATVHNDVVDGSKTTCEKCGQEGKRVNSHGWMHVSCATCLKTLWT